MENETSKNPNVETSKPEAMLVGALRQRAASLAAQFDPDVDRRAYLSARDDAELIRVLARILEGKTVYEAFGAPGDWGYESDIGKALNQLYATGRIDARVIGKEGTAQQEGAVPR